MYNQRYKMAEYHEQDLYAKERFETMSTSSFRPNVSQEKGCYRIPKKDEKGKTVNVNVYSSSNSGSYIRHAISGEYTKYIVGSKSEELFYKVGVSLGISSDGPFTLFFNSQDEYLRHL